MADTSQEIEAQGDFRLTVDGVLTVNEFRERWGRASQRPGRPILLEEGMTIKALSPSRCPWCGTLVAPGLAAYSCPKCGGPR